MDQDYDKYSALACLKETQGERVMKALKKIYDKMQTLEQAKERRKQRVESLDGQTDHPLADEFFRRLAKAEAQCKLLEQQLSYMRKIVAETHSEPQQAGAILDTQDDFYLFHHDTIPTKLPKDQKESPPPTNYHFPSSEETVGFLNKGFAPKVNSFSMSTHASFKNDQDRDELALSKIYNQEKSHRRRRPSHSQITQMSFVPAATSAKSHSLRANMQVFHSMVKYCNPVLCSASSLRRKRSLSAERHSQCRDCSSSRRMRSNSMSDLSNLLALTRVDESGTSAKSHSLWANMQVCDSMVKYCNPVLCSAVSLHRKRSLSAERHSQFKNSTSSRRVRSNSTSDLSNLLAMTRVEESGQRGRTRTKERTVPVNLDQRRNACKCNEHKSNFIMNGKKFSNAQKKLILRNLQQVNEILKHSAST